MSRRGCDAGVEDRAAEALEGLASPTGALEVDPLEDCVKVLIVDDDPIVRRFTAIVLETLAQVRTVEAGDLLEALTCAAAEQPDLVLLDGDLPILDGPHALAHLRADPETAHLPVVLLCNGDGARLAALGADGVVDKSLSPVSLAEAVLAALARLRTRLMRRPA